MAKKVLCPNCQIWHYVEDAPDRGTFENIAKRLFTDTRRKPHKSAAAVVPLPLPRQPVSSKETPSLPTRESHIKIPLEEAVISGLLAAFKGGTVGLGLALFINSIPNGSIELTNWGIIGTTGTFAALSGFYVMDRTWNNRRGFYDGLLWTIEEAFQMDLNRDGDIGEPEPIPAPKVVEVELRKNGLPWKFESFEISRDKLIKLARAVAEGHSFANRTASEAGIPREDFVKLRDKFVSRGLATWKGEPGSTQGVELTSDGLDTIVEIATTPLPRAGRGDGENRGTYTHPPTSTQDDSYRVM